MTIKSNWDFSHVKTDFEKENKEIESKIQTFAKKWKENKNWLAEVATLKNALDEFENIKRNYDSGGLSMCYLWLKTQVDQEDKKIKGEYNKGFEKAKELANKIRFFTRELSLVSPETQKIFLDAPDLKNYRHFLQRLFVEGKYRLSEDAERVISLKESVANDNWEKMTSELLAKEERNVDGKKRNFSEIISMISDKNKKTRDEAAKAFNDILAKYSDVAEHELNSILQDKKIDDALRKMPRPDLSRHIDDDINTEVVDTLVKTVESRFELAQEFYALKAKLLGQKKLQYHERNVSFEKVDAKYTFEDSVKLVKKVFGNLDKEFETIFDTALEEGRIDAYPKKGKRSGAFCVWWSPSKPVYVMLNHTDKLKDVTTIAHELGHAINGTLSKKQNALHYSTPISTTEVASTFMEDFVLQELIKEANLETQLSIIMEKLNDDVSTIFRQIACYKLETDLHNEFRKQGYLPKEEIGKIFQKNMSAYMGPAVEQSPGSQNWWIYWSHIRRYFYVYSYASGLLISKALQAKVKENPKSIIQIKEFLASGGSDSPENIFKKLEIDITKKEFWLSGIKETENLLNQAEKLAKKLKKI